MAVSGYRTVLEQDRDVIRTALDRFRYGDDADSVYYFSRTEVFAGLSHPRELYSYGRHFPLCRFVPAKLRGRGYRDLFILNGDEWRGGGWHPSRTPSHQEYVRVHVANYDADTLILPFSAVTGAGIDLDTIRPVHVRADARWTEELEARSLAELPRWERQVSYPIELCAATLEQVPNRYRETFRDLTYPEQEDRRARGYPDAPKGYAPILPDADGLYRWTETRYRDRAPDDDGLYRWTENRHRLGDSLFTAVRPEISVRRARPFENADETARWTVSLSSRQERADDCPKSENYRHESGPSSSCVHCGAELFALETWRRRGLYLSSFDTNEPAPLYFLAEVPRATRPDTVETALDALAPRAVHAARARGRTVARQGDVFFVDTDLTREQLAARGARFARLTMWTRDARSRPDEIGGSAPLTAPQRRRRAKRERGYARRAWRDVMRAQLERDCWHVPRELARELSRAEHGRLWGELLARHEREREEASAQRTQLTLADCEAPVYAPCDTCLAPAGAPCSTEPLDGAELETRTVYPRGADGKGFCRAIERGYRHTLEVQQERERQELKRDTSSPDARYSRPETGAKGRRQASAVYMRRLAELAEARAELRRVTLAGPRPGAYSRGYSSRRAQHVHAISRAREQLERIAARVRIAELTRCDGNRDSYRTTERRALETWRRALELAQRKYRPETVWDTDRFRARREMVRRACAIYGTAHSATELAHVNGAVYVRGTVRHVPELEPNRGGAPDHRPLVLTPDRWYLAVRNTVPRQARRRRRRKTAA